MSWQTPLLIPVVCSAAYWLLTAWALTRFFERRLPARDVGALRPRVSLIKPVCGLEKGLEENLGTALAQDYPDYEVVYSVQRPDDPALAVLERLKARAPERVKIVLDETCAGPNGRLCNILNATKRADGEVLVYSDSDMYLEPNYLEDVTAPLDDPRVGVSCTMYRAQGPPGWPRPWSSCPSTRTSSAMIFAKETRAASACRRLPGHPPRHPRAHRGLEPMADSLVEDYDLGVAVEGELDIVFVPVVARTGIDLSGWTPWWRHQVYWDQNTRAANPVGHFFTLLVRGVPFAVLYFLLGGPGGGAWLCAALAVRLATFSHCARLLGDAEGLAALWLLPLRDSVGLAVWAASFAQRSVHWKGRVFTLRGNKMVEVRAGGPA